MAYVRSIIVSDSEVEVPNTPIDLKRPVGVIVASVDSDTLLSLADVFSSHNMVVSNLVPKFLVVDNSGTKMVLKCVEDKPKPCLLKIDGCNINVFVYQMGNSCFVLSNPDINDTGFIAEHLQKVTQAIYLDNPLLVGKQIPIIFGDSIRLLQTVGCPNWFVEWHLKREG